MFLDFNLTRNNTCKIPSYIQAFQDCKKPGS